MKRVQFQGKTFSIDGEKSIDTTHFVIDFDTLECWAGAGRVDLILNNTLNFYKETIARPQKLQDKQFLEELQLYLKTVRQNSMLEKNHREFLDATILVLERLKRAVGDERMTNQALMEELVVHIATLKPELEASVATTQILEQGFKTELLKVFHEKTLKGLIGKLKGVFKKVDAKYPANRKLLTNTYHSLQNLSRFFVDHIPTIAPTTEDTLHPKALNAVLLIGLAFNLVAFNSIGRLGVVSQPQQVLVLVSIVVAELSVLLTYHYLEHENRYVA